MFFRMGDFYELFFDDAKVAAEVVEPHRAEREGEEAAAVASGGGGAAVAVATWVVVTATTKIAKAASLAWGELILPPRSSHRTLPPAAVLPPPAATPTSACPRRATCPLRSRGRCPTASRRRTSPRRRRPVRTSVPQLPPCLDGRCRERGRAPPLSDSASLEVEVEVEEELEFFQGKGSSPWRANSQRCLGPTSSDLIARLNRPT